MDLEKETQQSKKLGFLFFGILSVLALAFSLLWIFIEGMWWLASLWLGCVVLTVFIVAGEKTVCSVVKGRYCRFVFDALVLLAPVLLSASASSVFYQIRVAGSGSGRLVSLLVTIVLGLQAIRSLCAMWGSQPWLKSVAFSVSTAAAAVLWWQVVFVRGYLFYENEWLAGLGLIIFMGANCICGFPREAPSQQS